MGFFYKYGGKFLILKLYGIYRIIKNSVKGEFLKNKFLYLFGSRYFVHLVIIIIATLVATSNIKAHEKRGLSVNVDGESIISGLVLPGEFIGEEEKLIEESIDIEKVALQKKTLYYSDERRDSLSYQPRLDIPEEDIIEGLIVQSDGVSGSVSIINTAKTPEKRTKTEKYTVKEGDTVSSIAKEFNVTTNTIIWENNLNKYGFIKPGQELLVLPVTGITYNVKQYDTIGKIANKYGVSESEIMEINKIANAASLQIKQKLIIPGANKIVAPAPAPAASTVNVARYEPTQQPASVQVSNIKSLTDLLWPASCNTITQYFYWRHHGLDIACKLGTPLYAAEDGVVKSAGWATGYGKRVVIKHSGGMETLYGHMNEIDVQVGEAVNRGDIIGKMGSTGWSTGSHIHFEVIIGGLKKNPLSYLR